MAPEETPQVPANQDEGAGTPPDTTGAPPAPQESPPPPEGNGTTETPPDAPATPTDNTPTGTDPSGQPPVDIPPAPGRARRPRRERAPAASPSAPPAPAMPVVRQEVSAPKVQAPGWALVFMSFFQNQNKRRKKSQGLQHLIEHKLETPVFFIVSFTMIIRASQLFSGGQLVMSKLLGHNFATFEIITGIGLGIGSEMLMTISGRNWRNWETEATDTAARPGMSKIARQAYVNKAKTRAGYSRIIMFIGMGSSLIAGLAFLFTNNSHPFAASDLSDPAWWGSFFIDLVAVTVVTTTVFYLGVLKENLATTDAEEALAELDEAMNEATREAVKRFRDGKQTPVDEKLIAENLRPGSKAKFLRAVAKVNKGKVWTSKELRARLNIGNDATLIRKLNRRVNELSRDPDNALEKGSDGKTWLIPLQVVFDEWGDEIARQDAAKLIAEKPLAA